VKSRSKQEARGRKEEETGERRMKTRDRRQRRIQMAYGNRKNRTEEKARRIESQLLLEIFSRR
jgi:hypothetical protein